LKGRDLVNRMDVVDLEGSYGSWPLCSTIYMCVCVCKCVCVPLCSTIYILYSTLNCVHIPLGHTSSTSLYMCVYTDIEHVCRRMCVR